MRSIKSLVGENIYIPTPTEKMFKEILELLPQLKSSGQYMWSSHGKETCLSLLSGEWRYGSEDFYKHEGRLEFLPENIIEYKQDIYEIY